MFRKENNNQMLILRETSKRIKQEPTVWKEDRKKMDFMEVYYNTGWHIKYKTVLKLYL